LKPEPSGIPVQLLPFVQGDTIVVRSPGRINLIGEHTDYNDGYVLPAAIDKAVYLALTPRHDEVIHLRSLDFNEDYTTTAQELRKAGNASWPNYILGVADQFRRAGATLSGFDAVITGEIPLGAGLSSSAAVECSVAFALNQLLQTQYEKLPLVKLAQRAENEFVGVRCGIMDQFASVFGLANHAIRLDCRSLDYEYVPFNPIGLSIVLLDTGVKHSLASSEYNLRRQQCEAGVSIMQRKYPDVASLRDVTSGMLHELAAQMDAVIFRRCNYVVEENQRVLSACESLKAGDLNSFGKKMFQTHDALSREYEVSCPELDFLVDAVRNTAGVLGARMMGGGFGGCTINLIEESMANGLISHLKDLYSRRIGRELTAHEVRISDGTQLIA
jgi:galactokinase